MWLLVKFHAPAILPSQRPTEVTFIEKDPNKRGKHFVTETEKKQEVIEKLKDTADTLSALTKRVKKQMVARENGPTRNSKLQFKPAPVDAYRVAGRQQPPGDEGLASPNGAMRNVAIGGSSIAEYIPGVEEGAFTALNTDQLTYYTFFARVNEQVRNRWVSMIRNYMGSLSQEQLEHLSRADKQTIVEIVLSKTGEYIRSFLHSGSTVKALDLAASESFRAAAPFLNPPQGLVEADGYIHLRYVFMVRFRPSFGPGSN